MHAKNRTQAHMPLPVTFRHPLLCSILNPDRTVERPLNQHTLATFLRHYPAGLEVVFASIIFAGVSRPSRLTQGQFNQLHAVLGFTGYCRWMTSMRAAQLTSANHIFDGQRLPRQPAMTPRCRPPAHRSRACLPHALVLDYLCFLLLATTCMRQAPRTQAND